MNGIVLEGVTKKELISSLQEGIRIGFEMAGVDMTITTQEAARVLDVSEATIRNYHSSGKLKAVNPGRHDKWSLREVIQLKRRMRA